MPEITSNIELAHRVQEHGHPVGGPHARRAEWLEILEAVVLASVAVLTAWSGYQAARWDAKSAESYSRAAATNTLAQEQQTLAGQDHLYDITTFDSWLQAELRGQEELATLFERRFRPEFAVAFAAWRKTDPLHNPGAPTGPSDMTEYKNARADKARELGRTAAGYFRKGVETRDTGDRYVRITVILATVLLLTALSQRFKILGARVGLLGVAFVMLTSAVYLIVGFPRA